MALRTVLAAALVLPAAPALAEPALPGDARELPAYLECVPYARQVSGIQIYGDAWTWWDQAGGRYARGGTPRPGAVMAFEPHGSMRLGHVAAVSRVVDRRTVLLRHANWSPIDGRRGQIEDDVLAVDVSQDNDWSEVRVWYAPIADLGTTVWPVHGFIYPDGERSGAPAAMRVAAAERIAAPVAPSRSFLSAFSEIDVSAKAAPNRQLAAPPRTQAPVDLLAQLRR
jgi:surface antigen